jgi:non-reducing end alpha-L-arabinofuranosidase
MRASLLALAAAGVVAVARAGGHPCDLLQAAGTPCVAAHATTRNLFKSYTGPLYQLNRSSDHAVADVPTGSFGYADVAVQDAFCENTDCFISKIYDQSSFKNHLSTAPAGGAHNQPDAGVNATRLPITMQGHRVYGAYFEGGMGYRIDATTGVATGNDPETILMVTSGTHVNGGCCFDYGNAEVNNHDDGAGTMECVYFGTCKIWGYGEGSGPWVVGDLENGLWAGNVRYNPNATSATSEFVTAMVKGGTDGFALKYGNAQGGQPDSNLTKTYDGPRPNGYQPMKKQGAIILGIGGDNSDSAIGSFFEGFMTQGYTTDAVDNAVQANINAAGYGSTASA